MSVDPQVIEKLRKVLNLANGRGATQGEMEAALARAREIAMKHNIDLASVSLEDPNAKSRLNIETDSSAVKTKSAYVRKHHRWIWSIIKNVFDVHVVVRTRPRGSREMWENIWLVGEVNDLQVAREIVRWLDELLPEMFRKHVALGDLDNVAADAHGFYLGMFEGIVAANKRAEEQVRKETGIDSNKWALVVRSKEDAIEQKKADMFGRLGSVKHRMRGIDHSARGLGYVQGKQINLNQVGGSSKGGKQIN